MSNNTVSKSQQSQSAQNNIDKSKIEQIKTEANIQDKQKFERMAKLWELYNKGNKKDESEILAGPMDILREFGQFLVDLSNKDGENAVQLDTMLKVEYSLQTQDTGGIASTHNVDFDHLDRLAERILASLPTAKTPEVHIKVADNILPDTNITLKHVDGVLSVQIESANADAISLLGHQGAALQQMLESKTGTSVVVELNSERMQASEDSNQKHKDEQKQQNNEEYNDIG